jgi:hypothetical protein
MRRILIAIIALAIAATSAAGERAFDLDLETINLEPKAAAPPERAKDPRVEARRAVWNDPMTRWMYQLNQQRAWVMRGTMPGSDRMDGAVISVKAQGGLPLHLVASKQLAGIDLAEQRVDAVRWPWEEGGSPPILALDEQLSLLLGERLEGGD